MIYSFFIRLKKKFRNFLLLKKSFQNINISKSQKKKNCKLIQHITFFTVITLTNTLYAYNAYTNKKN